MAGEKIYSNHFQNITLIDPNKIVNANGFPEDRNVKQEDLVMYANLECSLQPRSRLVVGENGGQIEKISVAKVNFLKPNNQDYLTTNWTDFFTGRSGSETLNSELLGITNITYRCNSSFMPTVDIILEDIRGRALFESGNDSVYSVFFNLPYPTFYLTLKGYYGKAVQYQLILQKFQASFDQTSGNFIINMNFLGYKYNVLSDIAQAYLIALPSMYIRESVNNLAIESATPSEGSVAQINGSDQQTNVQTIYGGYEKIKEVYKIYKTKGLIAQDFPELTLQELINRLENFEKSVMSNFTSTSIEDLTNAKNFRKILNEFKKVILTQKNPDSVKIKNLNTKETYYVLGTDGIPYEVFTYKPDITDYTSVVTEFKTEIEKYNNILSEAPTFGEKAAKNNDYKISSTINYKNIVGNVLISVGDIDPTETAKKRYKKQTPNEIEINNIKQELVGIAKKIEIAEQLQDATSDPLPFFFRFDGPGFFVEAVNSVLKTLDEKVQNIEAKLTEDINKSLLSPDRGIGFNPTIRNVIGVIMASTDAFLRKMEEVHTQAFSNNTSLIKKNSCSNDVKQDTNSPVFPWPQFAVQISNSSGITQYDLKYPGDPKYIRQTGAYDYSVWPEVEFVEEFVTGLTTRQQPPIEPSPQANIENTIKRILISGFDVPSNTPYSNLQSQSFFYEIWERMKAISIYQGFVRNDGFGNLLNFIQAAEATNVVVGLGDGSLDINNPLKNNAFTVPNYIDYLIQISNNGVSQSWQNYIRGNFSINYLRDEILYPSAILKNELPEISQELITETEPSKVEDSINQYLKDTDKNFQEFTDTYPFILPEWNSENLNNSNNNSSVNKVLDVSKSLFYSVKQKKILNYKSEFALDNLGDTSLNRPFTYLPTSSSKIDYNVVKNSMDLFYENRTLQNTLDYTEGKINKQEIIGGYGFTSSMLNTPFFINAIQEGVNNQRNNSSSPYISASYLFLNSLPLADLTFQYLNTSNFSLNNYIGPTLRKYGAIHALPKTWIARIGAIWYRYKNFVESGTDILSSVMTNFNVAPNYDPLTNNLSKSYKLVGATKNFNIEFQKTQNEVNDGVTQTIESYVLGFYPKVLNDFYYFLNGENLYKNTATIEQEIQEKIDSGEIIIFNNSDSSLVKSAGYNPASPDNILFINNISVLFKSKTKNKIDGEFYYSAPSFGSRYNQVNTACFTNGILTRPIDGDVFNGSVRFFWGGTHFGYFPTITNLCEYNEIPKTHVEKQWSIFLSETFPSINENTSYIDYILATFTKEELDLFEGEFLNFAKSKDTCDDDFNLQSILQNSMSVNKVDFNDAEENNLLQKFQEKQRTNFTSFLDKSINLNYLFQKGNPTNINYKSWVEMSSSPGSFLVGAFAPEPYFPNSLPTKGNTVLLANSEINYPEAWKALKLNVGFFEFEGFVYSDNGSFITDFFVEMDVAFTKENIEKYASLIKIYATQKYLNLPNGNYSDDFRRSLNQYLTRLENLQQQIFTGTILKIQKNISEISVVTPEGEEDSKTTGELTKLEYYELFKAINDKWVAGNNYNSETMFEDILFFDRANRDIGDKVIVDIFETIKYLKANPKASAFQMAASIIQTNNFVIFPMPAYINFYNVQEVGQQPREDDEYSFAEKLFGVFSEVDYQGSKQKLVCQYTEKPSEQLNNPSTYNGYNGDTWNFGVPDNNPLIDKLDEKSNYALSNKVVGMNVDFGLQNQGVFKTIQVSQDVGKATSESLRMEYETANLTRGTQAFTQSVSLYNIYKSRSYSATITAFGNAIIQPTMYFNLQNVPLFSGPYLITDVEHVITNGDFTTKFTGTRQKLFTPPIENPLLSVIKNNFIDKLVDRLVTKRETDAKLDQNTIAQRDSIINSINDTNLGPSENPQCKPISGYGSFKLKNAPKKLTATNKEIQNKIYEEIRKLSGNTNMTFIVYTLFYLKSYKQNKFEFYENNVSQVPLGNSIQSKWGGNLSNFFKDEYMCLTDEESEAYAVFETIEKCVDFNYNKYKDVFKKEVDNVTNKELFISGFTKTWIEKVPYDKTNSTANLYNTFVTTNPGDFEILKEKVEKAWSSVTTYIS
jgi:hypothetical protein